MSVIAWDGKTLAADRQMTNQGLKRTCSKMRLLKDGTILAWVGVQDVGLALANWYEAGRLPEQWPSEAQKDKDDWTSLIVVRPDRSLLVYERYGEPIEILDAFMAWGSGRDFAIAAMVMSADARRAVEITCQFSADCGMGVEAYDLAELSLVKTGD